MLDGKPCVFLYHRTLSPNIDEVYAPLFLHPAFIPAYSRKNRGCEVCILLLPHAEAAE